MRWVDITKVGARPAMEISAIEQNRLWTERGTWRGITAELTVTYEATATGCRVVADFSILGRGLFRPFGPVLSVAGRAAVAGDLARAAKILSEQAAGR